MDADAVIAGLGDRFEPDEAAIAERLIREYAGTIPDAQLVEEIGLWGYPRLVDILTGWAMPRQERMPSWVRRGRVTARSSVPRLRVW